MLRLTKLQLSIIFIINDSADNHIVQELSDVFNPTHKETRFTEIRDQHKQQSWNTNETIYQLLKQLIIALLID